MHLLLQLFLVLYCWNSAYSRLTNSICGDCLIVTPLIKANKADVARHHSRVDPSEFLNKESYSGFLTVNEKYNSQIFFWFWPAPNRTENTPWFIWLQGGPGYTSLKGLFDLIGPIQLIDDEVAERPISWGNYSLLFLDNPVGSGYSFTTDEDGYPDNENDVGAQLYDAVQQFLEMFPELRSAPLFISGQSYAGKYAPALAVTIHRQQKKDKSILLKGITMGNALVDPRSMMYYRQLCEQLGLLDGKELDRVQMLQESIVEYIDKKKWVDAANAFNVTIEYIKKHSGVSVYDFTGNPSPDTPPPFEKFVQKPQIRKAIHVGNATFDLNNQHVYEKMLPDIMKSTKNFVEELLENNYGVFIYSGQLDVIVPYALTKHTYAVLQWSRRDEYATAPRTIVRRNSDNTVTGYSKTGGGLVTSLIRGAGHGVPAQQPSVLRFMLESFMKAHL